ncbi:MAG: hypothetical protein AAF318_00790 [Pseudomonadota bacterium]
MRPDPARKTALAAAERFAIAEDFAIDDDPRVPAMAAAVHGGNIVTLNAAAAPQKTHPEALIISHTVAVVHARVGPPAIAREAWGDINISARRFRDAPV